MSVADEIKAQLEPLLTDDLEIFIEGLSESIQIVEDYASDGPNGEIGWSILVDINRVPDEALPWLAQLLGVQLTKDLSPANQRQQIRDLGNLSRSTPAAMKAAPAPYLTGTKTVILRERFDPANPTVDSPGYVQVITITSETADAISVAEKLYEQKPAGIKLTYTVIDGQDYLNLRTNKASYTAVKNGYVTYNGVLLDNSGI